MARAKSKSIQPREIHSTVLPILEFSWASGLLPWSADEYARALNILFPEQMDPDPALEKRIHLSKSRFESAEVG